MKDNSTSKIKKVSVGTNLLTKDHELGDLLRKRFNEFNIKVIDVMGAIGAGKTTMLEKMTAYLKERYPVLVINGDVATTIDADRIKQAGGSAVQINTGGGCHLDSKWIQKTLDNTELLPDGLEPYRNGIIFVENVGNLICPANWDVGAHLRMVVSSITEGPYHVKKHPLIYKISNIAVFNKIDLAEAMEVDPEQLKNDALELNPSIKVCLSSFKKNEGLRCLETALDLRK